MTLFNKPLSLMILILVAVFMTAGCGKPSGSSMPSNEVGTQGTGGGSASYTAFIGVDRALDKALELAARDSRLDNVFAQFWIDRGHESKSDFIRTPTRLFPEVAKALAAGKSLEEIVKDPELFKSPSLIALTHNKMQRLGKGNCKDTSDPLHIDASVSAFNLSGELCFSIGNLERIPPSAILVEVLGLSLHEAVHLAGEADEKVAMTWQEEFGAYFVERFGELNSSSLTNSTLKAFDEDEQIISTIKSLGSSNQSMFKRMVIAGGLIQKLAMLPYLFDPLAIELKADSMHQGLITNYLNSVFALIQNVHRLYNVVPMKYGQPELIEGFKSVQPTLQTLENNLTQVRNNFQAIFGPEVSTACLLPDGNIDLTMFKPSLTGLINPLRLTLPPSSCGQAP